MPAYFKRERERERDRQTDRQTDRQRERERERETETETERDFCSVISRQIIHYTPDPTYLLFNLHEKIWNDWPDSLSKTNATEESDSNYPQLSHVTRKSVYGICDQLLRLNPVCSSDETS